MDKKVIYVDFKTASKNSSPTHVHHGSSLTHLYEKKSFTQKILEKLKKSLSFFKRNKASNIDISRHKHWL